MNDLYGNILQFYRECEDLEECDLINENRIHNGKIFENATVIDEYRLYTQWVDVGEC